MGTTWTDRLPPARETLVVRPQFLPLLRLSLVENRGLSPFFRSPPFFGPPFFDYPGGTRTR
jgi:hypothetical protein